MFAMKSGLKALARLVCFLKKRSVSLRNTIATWLTRKRWNNWSNRRRRSLIVLLRVTNWAECSMHNTKSSCLNLFPSLITYASARVHHSTLCTKLSAFQKESKIQEASCHLCSYLHIAKQEYDSRRYFLPI